MSSPTPGSTLTSSSQTFTWTCSSCGATAYWLDIGTTKGGSNLYNSGNLGNVLAVTASGLPTNGAMLYVTLFSLVSGSWLYNQYTYTALSGTSDAAVMSSPTPGSTLTGSSVTFTWTAGTGATNYWVDIGPTKYSNTWYQTGFLGNVLTFTAKSLPLNGNPVYVTLWSLIGGNLFYNEYQYASENATAGLAVMQTPAPGSTLTQSSNTWTWTADSNAAAYWIDIGTVAGGNSIFTSGNVNATTGLGNVTTYYIGGSTLFPQFPANGSTIYVTLGSLVSGQWFSNSYTYTLASHYVTLSWTEANNSDPAVGYNVYRSFESTGWSQYSCKPSNYNCGQVNASLITATTYNDEPCANGTTCTGAGSQGIVLGDTYAYAVTAVDAAGNESAYSTPVSVAIP
jgi:hypothetical protein